MPIFLDSHKILAFSPPEKITSSFGKIISIYGPSIEKVFFDIPLEEPSKFSIFIKHSLLFVDDTSQLYSPSFSVIAKRFQLLPESDEKYIFIFSDLFDLPEVFHLILWNEPISNLALPLGDLIFMLDNEKTKLKIIIENIYL